VQTCKRGPATQCKHEQTKTKKEKGENTNTQTKPHPLGRIACGQSQCTLHSGWRLVVRQIRAGGKKERFSPHQNVKWPVLFIGVLKFREKGVKKINFWTHHFLMQFFVAGFSTTYAIPEILI
jgi:hypothetical protein